jgi:hypothetical protein
MQVFALTYENDVVVELALVFAFAVHLCHLLERIEHGLHDLLISSFDIVADFQSIGADELCFDAADIYREIFDEWSNTLAFLAREFGVFNTLDLLGLSAIISFAYR